MNFNEEELPVYKKIESIRSSISVIIDGMKSENIYNDDLPKLINQWCTTLENIANDYGFLEEICENYVNLYEQVIKLKELEAIDNINKELFEIALKYVEKGYTGEHLRYGDDLYDSTSEERDECIDYYNEIVDNGTNWAHELLKNFK